MTEGAEGPHDRLQRVLATTPVGRQELRDPQSGLSLPQRWLLGQLDGEASLAELAIRPGSPAADRLPRDAAKLAGLGLALDVGAPGPSASSFGPSTLYGEVTLTLPLGDAAPGHVTALRAPAATSRPPRRSAPALVGAAALVVVGAAAVHFSSSPGGLAAQPASAPESAKGAAAAASVLAAVPDPAAATGASAAPGPEAPSAAVAAPASEPMRLAADPPAVRPDGFVRSGPVRAVRPEPAPLAPPAPAPVVADGPVAVMPAVAPPAAAPLPAAAAPIPAAPVPMPVAPAPLLVVPAPAPAPLPATPVAVSVPPPAVTPVAVPVTAAALVAPTLRPVSQVEPAFPREGLGLAGRAVVVQARLTVAPNGSVTQVSFMQRTPDTRVFERAARTALLQWRFPEGQGERLVVQQLRFSEQ